MAFDRVLLMRASNHSVERTGASPFAQLKVHHQWRLAPAAHADRWQKPREPKKMSRSLERLSPLINDDWVSADESFGLYNGAPH